MATNYAVIAPQTTFQCNNGVANAYQDIGQVLNIDDLDALVYAKVKTTHLGSVKKEHTAGLPGYDDMKIKLHCTRTGVQQCRSLRGVQGKTYRLVTSNGDTYSIDGWMLDSRNSVPEAESEDPNMMDVTLAVRDVTFTAGT